MRVNSTLGRARRERVASGSGQLGLGQGGVKTVPSGEESRQRVRWFRGGQDRGQLQDQGPGREGGDHQAGGGVQLGGGPGRGGGHRGQGEGRQVRED